MNQPTPVDVLGFIRNSWWAKIGLTLGFMLLVMAWVLIYLFVQLRMQLFAQDATLNLPEEMPIRVQVEDYLQVLSQGQIAAEFNMDHALSIPLTGQYKSQLAFDIEVPINIRVDYQSQLHLQDTLRIEDTTDLVYKKWFLPKFKLRLDVPVDLKVPFHLKRQYRVPVKIRFNDQVNLRFNEQLPIHIQHGFKPQLFIHDAMTTENIAEFSGVLINDQRQIPAHLSMQMKLPLKDIGINSSP